MLIPREGESQKDNKFGSPRDSCVEFSCVGDEGYSIEIEDKLGDNEHC